VNTAIITQVRMTSTRLPEKVLLPAAGVSLLQHHLRRLKWSELPVIIATTTNATDDPIEDFAKANETLIYRGSEHNVLDRYYQAALKNNVSTIIRVTSDCPLIDGQIIQKAHDEFQRLEDPAVYLCNTQQRTYPRGFDFEIFSFSSLAEAWQEATLDYEKEHVTPYIWKSHPSRFKIRHWLRTTDDSRFRLTVDEPDDYHLMKTLFEKFNVANLHAEEIIAIMQSQPKLAAMNAHVEQKKV
jgi:spore coat polysaccharide biosynthesis protein SpsF